MVAVNSFAEEERRYTHEATEQHSRLRTVGIFADAEPHTSCPTCTQTLPADKVPPSKTDLEKRRDQLASRTRVVVEATPRLDKAMTALESDLSAVQRDLDRNRVQMQAVRTSQAQVAAAEQEATRRAHVLGRVSLYAESIPDLPDSTALEKKASSLREQCDFLGQELGDEAVQERMTSIGSRLSQKLTEWAETLDLEHKGPVRLDYKKLILVTDTQRGRPVPMSETGSGENWVGYHVLAHLALHHFFARQGRPVPRMLFFDQASQIGYPPDRSINPTAADDEHKRLVRLFKLIFDVAKELAPHLQIVMTEHADLSEDWYQRAVAQRWRNGEALIPPDWDTPADK